MFVLGRVHVVAQRVGGRPELGLEPEVRTGTVRVRVPGFRHSALIECMRLCEGMPANAASG